MASSYRLGIIGWARGTEGCLVGKGPRRFITTATQFVMQTLLSSGCSSLSPSLLSAGFILQSESSLLNFFQNELPATHKGESIISSYQFQTSGSCKVRLNHHHYSRTDNEEEDMKEERARHIIESGLDGKEKPGTCVFRIRRSAEDRFCTSSCSILCSIAEGMRRTKKNRDSCGMQGAAGTRTQNLRPFLVSHQSFTAKLFPGLVMS